MILREAISKDATYLSSLAVRAKAYWGYSVEFMDACTEELSVLPAFIESNDYHYVVAEIDEVIVGFYALEGLCGDEIELGALFVDPAHIGTGVGKVLIEQAKHHALCLGAKKLNIQGDPNATKFYQAARGILTGRKESESIPGRYLPMFQITLVNRDFT